MIRFWEKEIGEARIFRAEGFGLFTLPKPVKRDQPPLRDLPLILQSVALGME